MVGGAADPNLLGLLSRAEGRGASVRALLIHPDRSPRITWDLDADTLHLDGEALAPRGVLMRADVFSGRLDPRPEAGWRAETWRATLSAWARAHPAVRLLNRGALPASKPEQLLLARRLGFRVPVTQITNDLKYLRDAAASGAVAKPVAGGGHCHPLDALLARTAVRDGATAAPAIVQPRLPGRNLRIFGVGEQFFGFWLDSLALDYRQDPGVRVQPAAELPEDLLDPAARLLGALRLDFAAIDLREDREGRPVFLEVNNQPMFAAFDAASDGALSAALLGWLGGA